MGSVFHGFLLQAMDGNLATRYHEAEHKPFRQAISFEGEFAIWEISTVNEEAYDAVQTVIQPLSSIHIAHRDANYEILKKEIVTESRDQFVKRFLTLQSPNRFANIRFVTPAAFKSQGRYVHMPTVHLILQSLLKKFDAFEKNYAYLSQELLQDMEEKIEIHNYRLKSNPFPLERIIVPAFMGTVGLKMAAPDPLKSFVHMLVAYGEYAGIGIKTALGMGKICKMGSDAWNENNSI